MKKIYLLICTIIIIFATTKIKSIDLSNELYPTSIGFDYNKQNNEYTLYFQIVNPSFLSKNENVRPTSKDSTFSLKEKGKSFYECYNKLNSITKKRISLRHIQSLILTKNFLQEKNLAHNLFKLLLKNPILPTNIYLYSTNEKIEDIYNNKNIIDESAFFSFINNPQDSNISSIIYPTTLLDACKCILDNQKMYYIPSIYLDDNIENTDKEGEVTKSKLLNIDGCYFTNLIDYSFVYMNMEEIKGFNYIYTNKINVLEINDYNNQYFFKIHNINSKIIAHDDNNLFTLELKNIDLLCPYNVDIILVDKDIKDELRNQLIKLYNNALEKNIDIFNIKDTRYRYKKSLNNIEISINIKTSYQSIQYYSSTTT